MQLSIFLALGDDKDLVFRKRIFYGSELVNKAAGAMLDQIRY